MALIIFEGPDNIGKTTQIENLSKFLTDKNQTIHKVHYSALKSDKLDNNKIRNKSRIMYKNLFEISNKTTDIFIADRFHLGEFVYGQLYRNYENPEDIFKIEDSRKTNLLIVFIDSPENLIARDDGKSFSTDFDIKTREIELFKEAYELSTLKKILINVNNLSIDEVWKKVKQFILKNTLENEFLNVSRMEQKRQVFMNIAKDIAKLSRAERLKVGAIIVKNDNIISFGYNGTPNGFDNTCEIDNNTKPEVLHAESNAILKCAKNSYSSEDSELYLTHSPCFECSKLIIQAGIKRVYYDELYRNSDSSFEILRKANIYIQRI